MVASEKACRREATLRPVSDHHHQKVRSRTVRTFSLMKYSMSDSLRCSGKLKAPSEKGAASQCNAFPPHSTTVLAREYAQGPASHRNQTEMKKKGKKRELARNWNEFSDVRGGLIEPNG